MLPHAGQTFVKICGITRLDDARAAIRAGANAVGFVFATSPRRVSPRRAAAIARHVHPSLRRFGVFVDATPARILDLVDLVELDAVQLQGAEGPEVAVRLKEARPGLLVAKVVRPTRAADLVSSAGFPADAIFVDPKDVREPAARSRPVPLAWLRGTGIARLVVAGGLTPATVGRLVREVRPWGVDVSAGVEESPGRKDPEKVRAFVQAVRRAERGVPG